MLDWRVHVLGDRPRVYGLGLAVSSEASLPAPFVARGLVARMTASIAWSNARWNARRLRSFARAEAASALDLRLAAAQTPSIERRARYLAHALDELRHADVFARAAGFGGVNADADDLYARLGELRFLAFVHRGERRGRAQFEAYRDHFARTGDAAMRGVFEGVLVDERRHEAYTRVLLVELAGGEAAARRALRSAAAWEAWRAWRRAGRAISGAIYHLTMFALYVAILPFALLVRWRRPARSGWRT